ncbi:uncharacterized protein LOC127253492 [Andrographis paniculata]|uniref:uncharacterized protein LOC127253492 n=1 Tax=Andrographis paniculata TaxID=175694 RepID=UPI0021E883A0|nr:uncharacterized protein LOC127253492 [Andrographis paniculata]
MPRQTFNVDVRIGGRKNCKVRKRGCSSSSSSSSLMANYGLKRALLMGKRVGSTTPVPVWKTTSGFPNPAILEKDDPLQYASAASDVDNKAKELASLSARKLAATLWEIDGISSPRANRENVEEKIMRGEEGVVRSPVSEVMDQLKPGSRRRRGSAGSQKLLQGDRESGGAKSHHNCLVETQNDPRSPCRHIIGSKNRLKDVCNSLITSKELLKVMTRVCRFDQHSNSTSSSLSMALKFELDRACNHVGKLIQEQRSEPDNLDILIKRFEEEKVVWKMKEQERIHTAIAAIAEELGTEKKLRRQTERLNKKLGRELAETKACLFQTSKELENERKAQKALEQACDDLAKGIGEDQAVVEELKRQSAKVREEVEKEREMLQLADVLREERVQMKLTEAKYQFEEKNALLEKLRNELESYLKYKTTMTTGDNEDENPPGSPSFDKITELKKFLRETLPPGSCQHNDETKEIDEREVEDDDDDSSGGSDLRSIELDINDVRKSFGSKRNSVDKSRGRKPISEKIKKPNVPPEEETKFANGIRCENAKQESLDAFDKRGLFEFSSRSWKNDSEDEMERYNAIKGLRDHIVSSVRMGSSTSPSKNFGQSFRG